MNVYSRGKNMITVLLKKILEILSVNFNDINDLLDDINEKLSPDDNE